MAAVAGTLISGAARPPVFDEALSFLAAHLAMAVVGVVMLAWAATDQRRAVAGAATAVSPR